MQSKSEKGYKEYEVIHIGVDLKGEGELLFFSYWVSNLTHLCYKISGLIYFSDNESEFIDKCLSKEYWWYEPDLSESVRGGKMIPKLGSISILSPGFVEIASIASIASLILNLLQIAAGLVRYGKIKDSSSLHNELKKVKAYTKLDKIHHKLFASITSDQLRDKTIADHIEKFDRKLSGYLHGIFKNCEVKEIEAPDLEKKIREVIKFISNDPMETDENIAHKTGFSKEFVKEIRDDMHSIPKNNK